MKGEVAGIYEDRIILEVGGIGYNIFMPASSLDLIEGTGIDVKVYTYLHVREDALLLYGFLTKDDLELYKLLTSVNGIGPKAALALLSVMNADELKFAILAGDAKQIGRAPGIGPKSAQRIIIDLKDKIDLMSAFDGMSKDTPQKQQGFEDMNDVRREAAQALTALGYSQTESYKAVKSIDDAGDVETVLKAALSVISRL